MVLPTPPEGLRPWRLADAPALEAAWADPTVRLWSPPPPDADATSWIAGCDERWSLGLSLDYVIDDRGDVAGEVGLRNFTDDPRRAELGIWLGPEHRGAGRARTVIASMGDWCGATLGLQQVWCRTAEDNERAAALFSDVGWQRLGRSEGRTVWCHHPPAP